MSSCFGSNRLPQVALETRDCRGQGDREKGLRGGCEKNSQIQDVLK
jgi:hypothetical protein